MRVLYLDIETTPLQVYTWGLFDQTVGIGQIIKPTQMLSFAAKWRGERRKMFYSQWSEGQDGMVEAAHELLDKADVLVHYNGNRFDEPHLRREMLTAGLAPPSPYRSLDLCNVVKRQFKFPSNKLAYVTSALGLNTKLDTGGFDLWIQCLAGDAKARKRMEKYNIQDVVILEELHDRILPYIQNHPHYGLYSENPGSRVCSRCGSAKLQARGYQMTQVGKYRRYQCTACGGWSRGKKALDYVDIRGAQ